MAFNKAVGQEKSQKLLNVGPMFIPDHRVLWILLYPASRPNHTSYRKFYFNEFVANVLRDNIDMIISEVVEAIKGIISRRTLLNFNSTLVSSHSASSAYQRFTKKWDQIWLSASIQPPYLEFYNQAHKAWFLVIIISVWFIEWDPFPWIWYIVHGRRKKTCKKCNAFTLM